ncbi:MAG: hypothetical protein ACK479_13835 [Fluviicola sp.]|jgi:hypothetical protein
MMFRTINEEVTYFSNNSTLILESIFVFSLPILGLLSIIFNIKIYKSISTKESNVILDDPRKINAYKNYFLLNVYFVFSVVLILHTLLRFYKLVEIINGIGNYKYLKIQAVILMVIVSLGIIFLVDTIKLRKKHIKS